MSLESWTPLHVPPRSLPHELTDQKAVVKKFVDKYDEWLLARRPDGMKEKPPSGRTWTIAECSSRSKADDNERSVERNKKQRIG